MFCENCGKELSENVKFCTVCGAKTEDPAAVPSPAAQPQAASTPPAQQQYQQPQQQYTQTPVQQYTQTPAQQYAQQPQQQYAQQPAQQYAQPPAQQYAQPPQQQYAQPPQPAQQQYAAGNAAPKKLGRLAAFRIVAAVLVVALVAGAGIGFFLNRGGAPGGNDNTIAKGATASAKDGIIKLNGVLLDFGGNNVGDATSLTVLKPTQEQEPGHLVSGLFEMKLDAACTSPVTVSIPFDASLLPTGEDAEDTTVMVGLGSRFPGGNGGTDTIYNFIPAEVEGGVATAVFVPADYMQNMYITGNNGAKRAPDDVWLSFGVFTVTARYEGGHFKIFYSNSRSNAKVTRADCAAILNDLESAYEFFLSKGYDYSKRTKWPLEVYLGDYGNPGEYTMGGVINKLHMNQWDGWIKLEDKFFIGGYRSDLMKPTIYHEFFHVVQSMYVSNYAVNRWFDEATSSYWEWSVKGSMPENVHVRLELLFQGLPAPDESASSGYVRSALLKYVIDKKLGGDDGFIRDMYEAEPGDWNAAFASATLPYGDYVTGFFTDFLNGGYGPTAAACYSDITSGKMAKVGVSKEMKLPDKDMLDEMRANGEDLPPLAAATVSVGAYGAQLVALPVYLETLEKLSDEDAVIFRASGDCDFRVFEISTDFGRAASVLTPNDSGAVVIEGLNNSTKNYMVLVVGLHDTGVRDCDVVVELAPMFPTLDELVGTYADGIATLTDVIMDPAYEAAMEAAKEALAEAAQADEGSLVSLEGCDINFDAAEIYREMIGQANPAPFAIIKTGENTGGLLGGLADAADDDKIDFTYAGGVIRGNMTVAQEGVTNVLTMAINAAYGPDKKTVVLDGTWILDMSVDLPEYSGNLMRIHIHLTGTKPIAAK